MITHHALRHDGVERHFLLGIPGSASAGTPSPLVIDLQASSITPEMHLEITRMDRLGDERGFIVAGPAASTPWPAGGYTWNIPHDPGGPDDVAFIRHLVDHIAELAPVDRSRVYLSGYSGGARLASELAWVHADCFAAIGVVGGLREPLAWQGGVHDVPIIAFHSKDDPVNPYSVMPQSAPPHWQYGVEDALQAWSERKSGITGIDETDIADGIVHRIYAHESGQPAMEFYRLAGSGHTWPGSSFPYPEYVGSTETRIDASELMLDFFERCGQARNAA